MRYLILIVFMAFLLLWVSSVVDGDGGSCLASCGS
jgi:hypothetical protein